MPQWKTDVEDVDEKIFDQIMAVNVKGVWLGAKYALPVMKRQRRGVFLITASTSAIRPRPGGQTYAASKGAVVTLTKALALEAAPHGVRVVAIAPVATHTPMLPTFMSKTEVDEEGLAALRGHRPARPPEPAGGPRAHRGLPRLRRRGDDHRLVRRSGRRPLHLVTIERP